MEVVTTLCGMCGDDYCGIDVHVDAGQIVAVKGVADYPVNKGKLCPKGLALVELELDPDRLSYPQKRDGDSWRRIFL